VANGSILNDGWHTAGIHSSVDSSSLLNVHISHFRNLPQTEGTVHPQISNIQLRRKNARVGNLNVQNKLTKNTKQT
jgi:hypothetical protein